jgi:hypothetical protein
VIRKKALQAGFTGLNTRQGDLLSVKVKAMDKSTLTAGLMPDTMFIVLHSDQIMEISDAGVQVVDSSNMNSLNKTLLFF